MTIMDIFIPAPLVWIAVLAYGAIIGSFLNVVIYRLPREESIAWPGSHCPQCNTALSWKDNLPLLSYALLKGRCRYCKEAISWRYPVVEALNAGAYVALLAAFGPTLQFLALAALASLLIVIFWIDVDTMYILNVTTYPGIALGILYGGLIEGRWVPTLIAAAVGYGLFWMISEGSRLYLKAIKSEHEDGMGMGDAKLAAMMGAWLGPGPLVVALFAAFLLGSIIGLALKARSGKSEPFPFGPALVIGAFAGLFAGEGIWRWYMGFLVG
jgi:leader peptidase (prepilin peptidase)/N-methyltransferase